MLLSPHLSTPLYLALNLFDMLDVHHLGSPLKPSLSDSDKTAQERLGGSKTHGIMRPPASLKVGMPAATRICRCMREKASKM